MDRQATESPPTFGYPGVTTARPAESVAGSPLRGFLARFGPSLFLFDGAVAAVLLVVALATRALQIRSDGRSVWELEAYVGAWAIAWMVSLWFAKAYINPGSARRLVAPVAIAGLGLFAAAASFLYVTQSASDSAPLVLALVVAQVLAALGLRWAVGPRARLDPMGTAERFAILVGSGPEAQAWVDQVAAHPEQGVTLVGQVTTGSDPVVLGLPVLGKLDELRNLLQRRVVDEVVVCLPPGRADSGALAVSVARDHGKAIVVPLGPAPGSSGEFAARQDVLRLDPASEHRVGFALKRSMDIVLSITALVVLSPLLVGVAILLLLREGRPILFVQQRVGVNGRMFGAYKFRTMVRDAEARLQEVAAMNKISGPALQVDNDPRVTRMGRVLRRTSIDELPQLINTLRGEMSIVGPRPAPTVEVDAYKGWHCRRLAAKPGITGLAQVEDRSYDDFDVRARLDIEYIDGWSLGSDLMIILKTIPQVLRGSGR